MLNPPGLSGEPKTAGSGSRIFCGTFMGNEATFMVFYNVKSKMVIGVGVELPYPSVESAHLPFVNLTESLQEKYPNATSEASKDPDGEVNGLAFNIPDKTGAKRIGTILQTMNVSDFYPNAGCSIYLMYSDMDNFEKSEAINNEDL